MFLIFKYCMNNKSFKSPCKVYYYYYITLFFLINFRRNADFFAIDMYVYIHILKRVLL